MLWMAQVATSHPSCSSGSWHRDSPCSRSSAVTQSIAIAAVLQPSAHCPGCSLGGVPRTPSLPILLILLQSLALKGWECLGVDPSLPRPWKELVYSYRPTSDLYFHFEGEGCVKLPALRLQILGN